MDARKTREDFQSMLDEETYDAVSVPQQKDLLDRAIEGSADFGIRMHPSYSSELRGDGEPLEVLRRLSEAQEHVDSVMKKGIEATGKWTYARQAEVYELANQALVKVGLTVMPIMAGTIDVITGKTSYGNPILQTRLFMDFVVGCNEGYIISTWIADGKLPDTSKTIGAAATYAERTFLIHLLRIPVTDIEDADDRGFEDGATDGTRSDTQPNTDNGRKRTRMKGFPDSFWDAIQGIGYWNDDSGEVNRHHFFQSKKNFAPRIQLVDDTAHTILDKAQRYAEQKRIAAEAEREKQAGEPATNEDATTVEQAADEIYP